MASKICVECNVEQDCINFYPKTIRCKPCYAVHRRTYKTPESIERHRVTASKYRQRMRERNIVEIMGDKKCWKCKLVKPRTAFTPAKSCSDGVGPMCKPCAREYRITATQLRKQVVNEWIQQNGNKCSKCENDDREVFDLDHCKGSKVAHVSRLVLERRPLDIVKAELEKVQILCVNCHRYKTAKERPLAKTHYHRTYRKAYVNDIKSDIGCCQLCNLKLDKFDNASFEMFDFDHIDPKNKCGDISFLKFAASMEKLNTEMEKCRLLCANCHRKVSLRQQESVLVQQTAMFNKIQSDV